MAKQIPPNDQSIRKVAGMTTYHATRLTLFVNRAYKNKSLLIIVRGSNPASLPHQKNSNMGPKPYTVSTKIDDSGTVVTDKGVFYSDYDLMGVYEQRHMGDFVRLYTDNSSNYAKDRKNKDGKLIEFNRNNFNPDEEVDFLVQLNRFVCADGARMFQHGANDDWLEVGRPKKTDIGDVFLAFEPTGYILLIRNQEELKAYYREKRISFNY